MKSETGPERGGQGDTHVRGSHSRLATAKNGGNSLTRLVLGATGAALLICPPESYKFTEAVRGSVSLLRRCFQLLLVSRLRAGHSSHLGMVGGADVSAQGGVGSLPLSAHVQDSGHCHPLTSSIPLLPTSGFSVCPTPGWLSIFSLSVISSAKPTLVHSIQSHNHSLLPWHSLCPFPVFFFPLHLPPSNSLCIYLCG